MLKAAHWYLISRHHLSHFTDMHQKGEVMCLKLNGKSVYPILELEFSVFLLS